MGSHNPQTLACWCIALLVTLNGSSGGGIGNGGASKSVTERSLQRFRGSHVQIRYATNRGSRTEAYALLAVLKKAGWLAEVEIEKDNASQGMTSPMQPHNSDSLRHGIDIVPGTRGLITPTVGEADVPSIKTLMREWQNSIQASKAIADYLRSDGRAATIQPPDPSASLGTIVLKIDTP